MTRFRTTVTRIAVRRTVHDLEQSVYIKAPQAAECTGRPPSDVSDFGRFYDHSADSGAQPQPFTLECTIRRVCSRPGGL